MNGAKSKEGYFMKKLITSGIISLAMASALMAAEGDIIIAIDESGSMGGEIQIVKDNIQDLINELDNQSIDYQLGLVTFGLTGSPGSTNPRVVSQLTDDSAAFITKLNTVNATGVGYEPGSEAVALGLSSAMEPLAFRDEAGTCVILLTDEDDDSPTITNALNALSARSAIFYGIVNKGVGNTASTYGNLATVTGGSLWDIGSLSNSVIGAEILKEVIEKCISEAIMPEVYFDIHPGGCPNPLNKNSKGVTPMAILGTADFNVEDINVSSLKVNGYSPVHSALEDVGTPYEDGFSDPLSRDDCNEIGADGFMDLTLNFTTQEILNDVEKGVQTMEITGQKYDGTEITGQDVVWVK